MSDPAEKLSDLLPLSPDHHAERLAALKRLFPDLFSNEGRLNVDELRKLADETFTDGTERYDFRWYGKTASKREACTPSRAALRAPVGGNTGAGFAACSSRQARDQGAAARIARQCRELAHPAVSTPA